MALSRVVRTGDGSTVQFVVDFALGYISEDDVTCRVGDEEDGSGDPVYRDITFLSETLVEISGAAPGSGVQVVFDRTVEKETKLVNFSDGDILDENNLDVAFNQILMAVHEVLDGRFATFNTDIDMGGYNIVNLGAPTEDSHAVTKAYVDANNSSTEAAAAAASAASAASDASTAASDAADAEAARIAAEAAAATLEYASDAEVLAGDVSTKSVSPSGLAYAYINRLRQEVTVEQLVGNDDSTSITGAQLVSAMAADTDWRYLRFLDREYDFTDAQITLPNDRSLFLDGRGSRVKLGTANGFVYHVADQTINNERKLWMDGFTLIPEYSGVTAINCQWNLVPYALWSGAELHNIRSEIQSSSYSFAHAVRLHNSARSNLYNLNFRNWVNQISGYGVYLSGYNLDNIVENFRGSYFGSSVQMDSTDYILYTVTGGSGTWIAGQTYVTSGGTTGTIVGIIDPTSATPVFVAEASSVPAVSETITITGSITEIAPAGATGTIASAATRKWSSERLQVVGGESVGCNYGIYLRGDETVTKKCNDNEIIRHHANTYLEAFREEFCTGTKVTACAFQSLGGANLVTSVSSERGKYDGSLTQTVAATGNAVLVTVGPNTYGTEASDDTSWSFELNGNFVTPYTLHPSATNFQWSEGPGMAKREYTPPISAQTGASGTATASGNYHDYDNRAELDFTVTINTVGTWSNALQVGLPTGHILGADCIGVAKNENTGQMCYIEGTSGNTFVSIRQYDATSIITAGHTIRGSVSYQIG